MYDDGGKKPANRDRSSGANVAVGPGARYLPAAYIHNYPIPNGLSSVITTEYITDHVRRYLLMLRILLVFPGLLCTPPPPVFQDSQDPQYSHVLSASCRDHRQAGTIELRHAQRGSHTYIHNMLLCLARFRLDYVHSCYLVT